MGMFSDSLAQKPKAPVKRTPKTATTATKIPANYAAAIDRISADSMRGHLSFLASDLLEGRATPSKGLDIAAEYIAAQFRRAGLEPAGDADANGKKTYFQTANWRVLEPNLSTFDLTFNPGAEAIRVSPTQVSFGSDQAIDLKGAALLKVDFKNTESLKAEEVNGKIVIAELPDFRSVERSQRAAMMRAQGDFINKVKGLGAAFVFSIDRNSATGRGLGSGRLIDPERPGTPGMGAPLAPFLTIHDPRVVQLFDGMKVGQAGPAVNFKIDLPEQKPVKLHNVAALLPGSDPALKDTVVIVSAHYDHVGVGPALDGDAIYNGANDDGSGTVSVVELATSLATIKARPRRGILFITWFGEERGLLGSRYYGKHPLFPLDKTVAMVNLEQVGRTDSSEGPQVNNASMTGFDFTDLGPIFKAAGEKTGITVYKHEQNSDAFFGRSDNQALADAGVPAHTLCTAFVYPDYHQPGDHWEKVDYENMARVNRMIGLSLLTIADNPVAPKWNETNPKTERYVKAWKALQGK